MSQKFIKLKTSIFAAGINVIPAKKFCPRFVDISIWQNSSPFLHQNTKVFLDDVIQIESGENSMIALTKQGNVYGKGINQYGELALGDNNARLNWTQIPFPFKVKQIACKYLHTLFLTENGCVYSCGANSYGQLGVNVIENKILTPTLVEFFNDKSAIKDVQAGAYHSIVLLKDGSVYAMGDKACCGQASATNDFYFPVLVSVGNFINSICCSFYCTLVQTVNEEYYAFGNGNGSFNQKPPAYGKEVSLTPERVDDVFPQGIQVRKLTATVHAFFMLTTQNELYVVGHGNDCCMGMGNRQNVDKWTCRASNVFDIQTGLCNSFVFFPCPFFVYESEMKYTDVSICFQ